MDNRASLNQVNEVPKNSVNPSQPVDNRTLYTQADAKTIGDVNATVQALKDAGPDQAGAILRANIQQEMRDHYLSPGQLKAYGEALTKQCTEQGLLNNITISYDKGHLDVIDKNVNTKTAVYAPSDYGQPNTGNTTSDNATNAVNTDHPNQPAKHEGGRRHRRERGAVAPTTEVTNGNNAANPAVNPANPTTIVPQGEVTRSTVTTAPYQGREVTTVQTTEVTQSTISANPNQGRIEVVTPPQGVGPGPEVQRPVAPPTGVAPEVQTPMGPNGMPTSPEVAQVPPVQYPGSPRVNVQVRPEMAAPPSGNRVISGLTETPEDQAMQTRLEQERNRYMQDATNGANGQYLQGEINQMSHDERDFYAHMKNHVENRDPRRQEALNGQERKWNEWLRKQETSVVLPRTESQQTQGLQMRLQQDWNHYQQDVQNRVAALQLQRDLNQVGQDSQAFHRQWRSENQDQTVQSWIDNDMKKWTDTINTQEAQVVNPAMQYWQQQQQARQYGPQYPGTPYAPQYPAPGYPQPYYQQPVAPPYYSTPRTGPNFNFNIPFLRIKI